MTVIASATGVSVAYRGTTVLDQVDLEVRAGEVLGLMGPNGGGKSTLLLTLAGLLRPTAGTVTVAGMPAHQLALANTGTVGLITTLPGLYPLLTGWENLEFFGALYGLASKTVRERVTPFLAELGLLDRMDRYAGQGSSGMQQKVSLARALLMAPDLLLLDEPTANLDPISADVIFRTARAHADDGHAVVWVTHDLYAAERICDRVALIAGRVVDTITIDANQDLQPPALLAQWRERLGDAA